MQIFGYDIHTNCQFVKSVPVATDAGVLLRIWLKQRKEKKDSWQGFKRGRVTVCLVKIRRKKMSKYEEKIP